MNKYESGAIIRGEYITNDLISFGGRAEGVEFMAPDPHKLIDRLPLRSSTDLADLYELTFDDIVDYLEELGNRLDLDTNAYMQGALEASVITNPCTRPVLESGYRSLREMFRPDIIREVAELRIGIDCLEGWAEKKLTDGRTAAIRAFGARALHIIAGNAPGIAAMTVFRNAISRSDAIIKSPSNDPYTIMGIGRTMIDMAPNHPLTKHLSVAYWKGGDEEFENKLYQPKNIEKIVAWGGYASVKHISKYIQPGIDLITLDPKQSKSIIGPEALVDEATQKDVAKRLAADIGSFNQEGCVNARVIYVQSGTDDEGLAKLNQFGKHVYEALINLPESTSTKARWFDSELRSNVKSARLNDDWYHVIGGEDDEGSIIVSQLPEPVEFATLLANRVANLVPLDDVEEMFDAIDASTQTVGIYPESLKTELRDRLPLYGAQRIVSLGYASSASLSTPDDAIEPLRRMCKWILDESCDPEKVHRVWEDGVMFQPEISKAS